MTTLSRQNYWELLEKLMSIPVGLALSEASSKLQNTFLLVNDSLMEVVKIRNEDIVVNTSTHKLLSIPFYELKSLEIWLPKTGVYSTKTGHRVFLQRIPYRQWKRSFSPTFYKVDWLSDKAGTVYEIDPSSRVSFWVDSRNYIWFYDNRIGRIGEDSSVVCTDERFVQELSDFIRDNPLHLEPQITKKKPSQKQSKKLKEFVYVSNT